MGWPTQGMRETRPPLPNNLTAQLSQFSSSAISLFFSLFFLHPFSPLTSFLSNFACPVPVISPFASPSHPPYIFLTLFFLPQLIRLIFCFHSSSSFPHQAVSISNAFIPFVSFLSAPLFSFPDSLSLSLEKWEKAEAEVEVFSI